MVKNEWKCVPVEEKHFDKKKKHYYYNVTLKNELHIQELKSKKCDFVHILKQKFLPEVKQWNVPSDVTIPDIKKHSFILHMNLTQLEG